MKPVRYKLGKVAITRASLLRIGAGIVWRNAAIVGFLFSLVIIALLLTGCANAGGRRPPLQVPPKPSTVSTATAVDGARESTAAAQGNVRAGAVEAKADRGPAAVPFLERADGQLSDALARLDEAKQRIAALELEIVSSKAAYDRNLKEAGASLAKASKDISKLAAENAKLNNEVQRTAWRWMVGIGTLCLALAAAAVVAFFFSVFPAGMKLGPPLAAMGGMCLAVATMLSKIILAAQIAVGAGFACVLAYGAWKFWQSHRTLNNVVTGVQAAKQKLPAASIEVLASYLTGTTSAADKKLIEALKSKLSPFVS